MERSNRVLDYRRPSGPQRGPITCLTLRLLGLLLLCLSFPAILPAQTRLKLSTIKPGTENVQLVPNGDFQFQGPLVGGNRPFPDGWSPRVGEMFVGPGTNQAVVYNGIVARAHAGAGAPVSLYQRTLNLEPATDYVLSGYMWNMGNAANHVTAVIDMNDAAGEPQIILSYSDPDADQGYFVYRNFNTTNTGSTVTLRIFYDAYTGGGTTPAYSPVAAQWDNIAITRATDFIPPNPIASGGNLRPAVSIFNPTNGASLAFTSTPASLVISATATDFDGSISKVEFYDGVLKLGEDATSPYSLVWSNPVSGSCPLTAVATDNQGATTRSAFVTVSLTVPPEKVALRLARQGANLLLSWSNSVTLLAPQSAPSLTSPISWKKLTNAAVPSGNSNIITLSNHTGQTFFRLAEPVDPTTLNQKLLMGYQGWFACPGDGSAVNDWVHWFRNGTPTAANLTVDFWPDIGELDADELFATSMTLSNGSPAKVYSAYKQKTVARHFRWMKENNLDGVFLQRFTSELSDPRFFALRNQVAANVRFGAESHGRVFAIMYDISGQPAATLVNRLKNDWAYLAGSLKITNSPRYLRHKGKPVLAIWGLGFTDRPGTPQDATNLINYFKAAGLTVMGGVPTYWRTLTQDSQTNAAWAGIYRSFDIISPWSVGRYSTLAQADNFRQSLIVPDRNAANSVGADYMPVIWPGFSWYNLLAGPLNQIPRNGGAFYWRQAYNAQLAGCTMVYGAMFDEVDEGTAMFKMAPTPATLPVQGTFVPLNIDGYNLPSDWYLRLAGEATKMLRGEIPLQSQMPIAP